MNINTSVPGNSAISAWISADGNYAFVEFRTPEEAANAFALNNVAIFGKPLKVGRPRTYQTESNTMSTPNLLLQSLNPLIAPLTNPLNLLNMNQGNKPGSTIQPQIVDQTTKVQPPSTILVFKNLAQPNELEIDEEYSEILEDVKEECGRYGEVVSLKIPRPKESYLVPGLGKVFVEYKTIDEAKEAKKNITGKTFSNNTVECSYYDPEKYKNNVLDDN